MKLPLWYNPKRDLSRLEKIETHCIKVTEASNDPDYQKLLRKIVVQKKEIKDLIIRYGVE